MADTDPLDAAASSATDDPSGSGTGLDALERRIAELDECRRADRIVVARLKRELDTAQRALSTAEQRRDELIVQNAQLRDRLEQMTRRAGDAATEDAADHHALRSELAELRETVVRLEHERDTFRDRLQAQYDLRWTRLGSRLRQVARLPHTVVRLPKRAMRRLRRLVRGTSTPSTSRPQEHSKNKVTPTATSARAAIEESEALLGEGRDAEAIDVVDRALAKAPNRVDLLIQRRRALVAVGELSAALATTRSIVALDRSPDKLMMEEQLAGRLRDLDPDWYPDLGRPEVLEPLAPNRVLHLLKESLPYHERGYTMRSRYALLSQRDAGLDPAVVTSLGFPRTDGFEPEGPADLVDGITHYRLDLGADYPYRRIPFDQAIASQAWLAMGAVQEFRPAVLHANSGYRGYDTAVTALALRARFGIPVVYDVRSYLESTWTSNIERSERGEHYERRVRRENRCMQDADLVFTIAETMRAEIVDRGIHPDKIVVIPNAVDVDRFQPLPRDEVLEARLGLEGRTVLGYISNIGHREGIDILVRAMRHLVDEQHDVACLVVGDGPELDGLHRLRSELGLDEQVVLTGQVAHDEIDRYYSLIDLFVVPRRDDRAARLVTPLKPFEAMAMERPLLVADLPALVEVAAPGERGAAFRPEDPQALAAAAIPLIRDPDARRRLGESGRAWVTKERTWARNGERYIEAYRRLGVRIEEGRQ